MNNNEKKLVITLSVVLGLVGTGILFYILEQLIYFSEVR